MTRRSRWRASAMVLLSFAITLSARVRISNIRCKQQEVPFKKYKENVSEVPLNERRGLENGINRTQSWYSGGDAGRSGSSTCANCFPALVVFSLVREDLLDRFLSSIDMITEHVFVVCNFETQERKSAIMNVVEKYSDCLELRSTRCKNPNLRTI